MINIEEVRAKFPNAMPCLDDETREEQPAGCYCVLGAAIMHKYKSDPMKTSDDLRFPSASIASSVLGISYMNAERISDLNDEREIEAAWYALALALQGQNLMGLSDDDE